MFEKYEISSFIKADRAELFQWQFDEVFFFNDRALSLEQQITPDLTVTKGVLER